ncbi:uncharacterized protein LOC113360103 [Papaver somniferum]|uniref:uncharacterized protein LOC113360103 n=1 Tax=Papaver somniferum TaxID=3469 RepID=UPI000E6FF635|nr:uncharacterized protein LOC113360103 [Papaver somniferum]
MKKLFLDKYFPASKEASVRKEISSILQITGESLYEYWERYKRLLASFPHHNISPTLIIQYFYEGLLLDQRNLIDAAAGGSLTKKTISHATSLIESMASNAQNFYTRHDSNVRRVSEIGDSNTEHRLSTIEKAIHRITSVVAPPYKEDAEVNYIFPNQRPSYANKQAATPNPYVRQGDFQQQQPQNEESKFEALISIIQQGQLETNQFIQKAEQNQLKTDNAIRDLHTQMGQLDTNVNQLKVNASKTLISQPFVNQREHVNAVTLRSGRKVAGSNLDRGKYAYLVMILIRK